MTIQSDLLDGRKGDFQFFRIFPDGARAFGENAPIRCSAS